MHRHRSQGSTIKEGKSILRPWPPESDARAMQMPVRNSGHATNWENPNLTHSLGHQRGLHSASAWPGLLGRCCQLLVAAFSCDQMFQAVHPCHLTSYKHLEATSQTSGCMRMHLPHHSTSIMEAYAAFEMAVRHPAHHAPSPNHRHSSPCLLSPDMVTTSLVVPDFNTASGCAAQVLPLTLL